MQAFHFFFSLFLCTESYAMCTSEIDLYSQIARGVKMQNQFDDSDFMYVCYCKQKWTKMQFYACHRSAPLARNQKMYKFVCLKMADSVLKC